jgi:hypothetical protein
VYGHVGQGASSVVSGPADSKGTGAGAEHVAAALQYGRDDIGTTIQMFSFRFNAWDNITLVDFDVSRSLHKCKYKDGSSQWLDLSKKPIRAIPLDGDKQLET